MSADESYQRNRVPQNGNHESLEVADPLVKVECKLVVEVNREKLDAGLMPEESD
jgi:hypothetical protein